MQIFGAWEEFKLLWFEALSAAIQQRTMAEG